mmetsp:Transcript_15916/g.33676  ORF Transcript_15916/g.33676 Transcript_15916/m.33676 type:complete len:202 (+) Transcript_15916:565-1170(+)
MIHTNQRLLSNLLSLLLHQIILKILRAMENPTLQRLILSLNVFQTLKTVDGNTRIKQITGDQPMLPNLGLSANNGMMNGSRIGLRNGRIQQYMLSMGWKVTFAVIPRQIMTNMYGVLSKEAEVETWVMNNVTYQIAVGRIGMEHPFHHYPQQQQRRQLPPRPYPPLHQRLSLQRLSMTVFRTLRVVDGKSFAKQITGDPSM